MIAGASPLKRMLMLFFVAAYLVFAGNALKAANDTRALQLTYEPWIKFCFGNAKCVIGAGAKGACFPSGGAVSIITDDQKTSLSVQFGTTRTVAGAIGVQIDQDAPILIPHPECDGLACRGKLEIDNEFVERLKRSQTITITATDSASQKLSLSLSLADFAKAYDGPESDPPKVHEGILGKKEYKKLVQRQEEERKALQCRE